MKLQDESARQAARLALAIEQDLLAQASPLASDLAALRRLVVRLGRKLDDARERAVDLEWSVAALDGSWPDQRWTIAADAEGGPR